MGGAILPSMHRVLVLRHHSLSELFGVLYITSLVVAQTTTLEIYWFGFYKAWKHATNIDAKTIIA